MEFTGERVVPGQVDADLWNEHVARYAFASRICARLLEENGGGLRVLDAGCGSGYGAAVLAQAVERSEARPSRRASPRAASGDAPGRRSGQAVEVVGVDISEEALAYAAAHYQAPNLRFQPADCLALPFGNGQFDVVVAFEIIEHLPDAPAFLKEAARVLAPGGQLVVSTPNRRYYSEERQYTNPFHTREYDPAEFDQLLEPLFAFRLMFAQNHAAAISFTPCGAPADGGPQALWSAGVSPAPGARDGRAPYDEPHFLVALASRERGPVAGPFVFVPAAANVLRERETHIRKLEGEIEDRKRWAGEQQQQLAKSDATIRQLQQEHQETVAWGRSLEDELARTRELLDERQQQLNERALWAQQLDREIERLEGIAVELQRDVEAKVEWARSLEAELGRARQELDSRQQDLEGKIAWAKSLEADLEQARLLLDQRQAELDDRTAWAFRLRDEVERVASENQPVRAERDQLRAEREQLEAERDRLRQTLAERTAWAQSLDTELEALRADMRLILGSFWYRLGKNVRLSPVPQIDRPRGNG
jgi:SAM-dependent methyltransferase